MNGIVNYTNLKIEISNKKLELNMLITKKMEIYKKHAYNDEKAIKELNAVNQYTGVSLEQSIDDLMCEVETLQRYKQLMEFNLLDLQGIEAMLYKKIVNGSSVNQAIEDVAKETNYSEQSIWNYYKNIKEEIHKLKKVRKKNDNI